VTLADMRAVGEPPNVSAAATACPHAACSPRTGAIPSSAGRTRSKTGSEVPLSGDRYGRNQDGDLCACSRRLAHWC
jgi:hypothetical protein